MLAERLGQAQVGQRLGTWLSRPANAARAGDAVADLLKGTLEVLDDKQVQEGLEKVVRARIDATPAAPLVGRIVEVSVEGGHHQRLLDAVLVGLRGFLDDNRRTFRQRLEQESPWWVPEPIDDRIFKKIYTAVERFMDEVAADQNHEVRRTIDQRVARYAERLQHDPTLLAKGEELKRELLEHPDVRAWLESLWLSLKEGMVAAADDPRSELRVRLLAGLQHLGERLVSEPELQQKFDRWVERAVGYLVEHYRSEVSDLIATTVERWDAETTSRKVELQVGRDLQFIRINGTIVGGLAGVMIHFVGEFL